MGLIREINLKESPASLRRRIISIEESFVNHAVMALRFCMDMISCDFWYCLKCLLLTKIDKSEIEKTLATTHKIWMPKLRPT